MNYCDDCGEEIEGTNFAVIEELAIPVDSANTGESATLCLPCYYRYQGELDKIVRWAVESKEEGA